MMQIKGRTAERAEPEMQTSAAAPAVATHDRRSAALDRCKNLGEDYTRSMRGLLTIAAILTATAAVAAVAFWLGAIA